MLHWVIIHKSFTGNNPELATDLGWVNARVLDLSDSWASQYEYFKELFIGSTEQNLSPLPLDKAAWKWDDRMAFFF